MPVIPLTFTNDGHNLFRNGATGADNPKIKYFAMGTGTNAPTVNDHTLQAEVFRKAVTSFTNGSNVGEALINVYVAPGDAVGVNIQEVAVFGGNTATSAANSGVMLGRALWSHNPKTNMESLQLQLDITS